MASFGIVDTTMITSEKEQPLQMLAFLTSWVNGPILIYTVGMPTNQIVLLIPTIVQQLMFTIMKITIVVKITK